MSWRIKSSLYSPKSSASNQAATSSGPQLSTGKKENYRMVGWGREGLEQAEAGG